MKQGKGVPVEIHREILHYPSKEEDCAMRSFSIGKEITSTGREGRTSEVALSSSHCFHGISFQGKNQEV
jgi:hypothetical protein